MAGFCREAGVSVRFNAFFRDMNIDVRAADDRRIEVPGFASFGGAQLPVDVFVVFCLVRENPIDTHPTWMELSCWRPSETKRGRTPRWQRPEGAGLWLWPSKRVAGVAMRRWISPPYWRSPERARCHAHVLACSLRMETAVDQDAFHCARSHSRHLWWSRQLSVSRCAGVVQP